MSSADAVSRRARGFPGVFVVFVALRLLLPPCQSAEHNVSSGAVATVHALATDAAMGAFERGGNAIDAAVAAALVLGVVDGENSGIGGGCFALVRLANGRIFALDGREMAPARATRTMYVRDGKSVPELSLLGPLSVGIPGELAVLDRLARHQGRLKLEDALDRAARIAEDGFVITKPYADRLRVEVEAIRRFPPTAEILLRPDGSPWGAGETLRQHDLAVTYRQIAKKGVGWFYGGPFAKAVEAWMRREGGLATQKDFQQYRVKVREPVETTYRGFTIVGFPPPSSGGVHVAQVLNLLQHFDLRGFGAGSADFAHVCAESLKLAFADRAYWLGDPDFVRVPQGLVSQEYADTLARRIRLEKTSQVTDHGEPPDPSRAFLGKHTTHFSVADSDGNWVAITATVNTTFGSKVVVPGTGVFLNNQMDDFAAEPGATNFFGLTGSEANSIAAGKRPLSSMSPTLVLKDGNPILAVGAAGGPTIISQTILAVVRVLDFGADVSEALRAPRLHHQWRPDELLMEPGWDPQTERDLEQRGHILRHVEGLGACQAVGMSGDALTAAADPRVSGSAAVWKREMPPH